MCMLHILYIIHAIYVVIYYICIFILYVYMHIFNKNDKI